ncbi:type IV pilin [Halobacteria archaeon AArc-dxtr1]|nr:type IV pilin [Halobacteria archaeon AArc-dxtr1]
MRSSRGLTAADRQPASEPAVSPVVGVVVLVVVTVLLAGALAVAMSAVPSEADPPTATFGVSVDANADQFVFEHRGGDAVDVASLSVEVTVDGEALRYQPPVPFFSAQGFESGPTGPFNPSGSTEWSAGAHAGFSLAGTNAPRIEPGDRVTVAFVVDGHRIAELVATA